jgi:hypothetical protein
VLGSLKCDCGPQLHAALTAMQGPGGVLLYLNQEGRGIGLANKMRAYSLQDQGFDTVEANHRLGFEDDERDFRLGAELLRRMGFAQVRLLTNNPRKVAMLEKGGIVVTDRVPLAVGQKRRKRRLSGHQGREIGASVVTLARARDMVLTPMGLRFAGRTFPCSIGRGGIHSDKREGDGATPRGNTGWWACSIAPTAWPSPPTGRCPSGLPTCGRMTGATPTTT